MIAILKYRDIFKDIFDREPVMPTDYLDDKLSKDVKNAVSTYSNEKVISLASVTFETWDKLMKVLNNDRNSLSETFYIKEINAG